MASPSRPSIDDRCARRSPASQSEFEEIQESLATTGVPISAGYRFLELPAEYEVDGIFLPRPFKIVKHGPVNIFVSDVARSRDFLC